MDLETRVKNLEDMLSSIVNTIINNQFYTDADLAGVRKNVSDITPYTASKDAYYGETEKTFYNVPEGNLTVFFSNYGGDYRVSRVADRLTISFCELQEKTSITISIQ